MVEKIGIDVGGVIIASHNDHSDTSFFSDNYLNSVPTDQVFESIASLRTRFGDEMYIVSKCGKRIEAKTREWFDHNRVYEQTGLSVDRMHFTRTREGKAPICAHLGITHFVDDRLDVLRHLSTVDEQFLFQGHASEMEKFSQHLQSVHYVRSWPEIVYSLL